MGRPRFLLLTIFFSLLLSSFSHAADTSEKYRIIEDKVFANTPAGELKLDLYLPPKPNPLLVIWVHGGAWHSGSRKAPPLLPPSSGIALASIDYRLSTKAAFPAQLHDIKAAVRYLRANAKHYAYREEKIAIWGASAGAHLATLAGVTNGNKFLEGKLGEHLDTSSHIHAIVDYFGPTNLQTILEQSTPHGLKVRAPALALLLGAPLASARNKAVQASPVEHLDGDDPPLMIVHGNYDIQVPINQSIELAEAYKAKHLDSQLIIAPKGGHSSAIYFREKYLQKVDAFLKEKLQ